MQSTLLVASSSHITVPSVGIVKPQITLNKLVLPVPLAPLISKCCPLDSSKEIFENMRLSLRYNSRKLLWRLWCVTDRLPSCFMLLYKLPIQINNYFSKMISCSYSHDCIRPLFKCNFLTNYRMNLMFF